MDVLAMISNLHEAKKSRQIVPDHVTEVELISEVCRNIRNELSLLLKEGAICEVRTLNDKAYVIKN